VARPVFLGEEAMFAVAAVLVAVTVLAAGLGVPR
jgi:hypothetical protein